MAHVLLMKVSFMHLFIPKDQNALTADYPLYSSYIKILCKLMLVNLSKVTQERQISQSTAFLKKAIKMPLETTNT